MTAVGLLLWLSLPADLAGTPAFDEGVQLFRSSEYEQAVFRFQEAAVAPGLSNAERAEALVWLGMSYAGAADEESARRAFRDAQQLAPEVRPPASASPKLLALFDEVQRSAEPAAEPSPPPSPPAAPPPDDEAAKETSASSTPAEAPPSWLVIGGAASAAAGVVALLGAGALGLLAAANLQIVDDRTTPQIEAQEALDAANAQLAGALVVTAVGVALLGTGGALVALDLAGE